MRCTVCLALFGFAALLIACARRGATTTPAVTSRETVRNTVDANVRAAISRAFEERQDEREALVRDTMEARDITDPRVLAAMRRVPRHRFVPELVRPYAYNDRPLPIGWEQTISQPYIVAMMTQAVAPRATDRCLEVGTGSGYQAAVLAELCAEVWTIEYHSALAEFAEANLRSLGYRVHTRAGDGYGGWPDAAPFDVIVVTAAPEHVPAPLLEQLAPGGRLVIPVGSQHSTQQLELWTRGRTPSSQAEYERRALGGVLFVPFLGDGGTRRTP